MTLQETSPATPLLTTLVEAGNFHRPRLKKALDLAQQIYGKKMHWTGVTLFEHSLAVLQELLPFQPDEDAVIGCVLHEALDTRQITLTELDEEFGPTVRELVSGVHLLSQVQVQDTRNSVENLRLMLLSVSNDVRVVLITLCDRVTLLSFMDRMDPSERRWTCQNILGLFAPVAARLGIHVLKQRMENLAFSTLYPVDASSIGEQISHVQGQYGAFLSAVAKTLEQSLREQGITVEVEGREKQIYSIFNKMKAKGVSSVAQLQDLFALRVFVETEEDCYRALGALHRIGLPAPNRFKDYVAFPKPNGYRSLHTTMVRLPGVPEGLFVEIQIRTREMHREAEYGIAAHWSYKERGSADRMADRVQLQEMLTRQHSVNEEDREAGLSDHIFVLTPSGDIVELPEGATPLDFAFQIHTDLGLAFRSARVNGAIVPLNHELENGDVVEIIRHKQPNPSPEWLTFVKMASSRARLKRYLYSLQRSDFIVRGRELLNEELRKLNQPLLDTDYELLRHYDDRALGVDDREDLLVKIGQGSEKVGTVLGHLREMKGLSSKPSQKKSAVPPGSLLGIEIEGGVPMPVQFAKCCGPDSRLRPSIVGLIGRGGRVMIHLRTCRNIRAGNKERRIGVKWVTLPLKRKKKAN